MLPVKKRHPHRQRKRRTRQRKRPTLFFYHASLCVSSFATGEARTDKGNDQHPREPIDCESKDESKRRGFDATKDESKRRGFYTGLGSHPTEDERERKRQCFDASSGSSERHSCDGYGHKQRHNFNCRTGTPEQITRHWTNDFQYCSTGYGGLKPGF